jgi:phenylalanyl-tRNA synthetase beta chain
MKLTLSWLREFAAVPNDVRAVAARLSGCGFNVESVEGETMDVEVTANRPDCLGVYGLAREAAAAFDVPLGPAPGGGPGAPAGSLAPVPVAIEDAGCGRYAMAAAEVTVAPSPSWLTGRLASAGIRPINNIVDVTNYVMVELGHPMHAFDAARLAGPEIRVRPARAGETLRTLDGQDRTLAGGLLVIADREHAVALAGVMGGAASEVSGGTTRVALESAWFSSTAVRATSRALALKTEASARFERGADPEAPVRALRRALELLARIGAVWNTSGIVDERPAPPEARVVPLSAVRLARLLGDEVPAAEVERVLSALGFTPTPGRDGWHVAVPSFRVDVAREADLIEEVGRHWGFDRVPATFPALRAMPRATAPGIARGRSLRRVLCGAGLQEAATFTFIEHAAAAPFAPPDADRPATDGLVRISNPLSEKFAVLRPSLLPGLLDSLIYSRHRESSSVALFEVGAVFSSRGESSRVGWLLTGSRGEHWSGATEPVGFTDAKGVAELLAQLAETGLATDVDDTLTWFVPGRRARLSLDGAAAGWVGQLAPALVAARGLAGQDVVVGGELELSALAAIGAGHLRVVSPLPKFPSIVRDLSLVVDERLPAGEVRGTIRTHAPDTLVEAREFDRYQGKGVPEGRVSLSVRLTFRDPNRTLTDAEVQHAVDGIVAALVSQHAAVLRGTSG